MRALRAAVHLVACLLLMPQAVGAAQSPRLQVNDAGQGYRTIAIDAVIDPDPAVREYQFWFSDRPFDSLEQARLHSIVRVRDTFGLERTPRESAWDDCREDGLPVHRDEAGFPVIAPGTTSFSCALTGMRPGIEQWIVLVPADAAGRPPGGSSNLDPVVGMTSVVDTRPPPPDTLPVLLTLGSVVLSIGVLLTFLRRQDARRGRSRSRLAHWYVAPAIIALATLTVYPIGYGFILAFTDADQSHLGQTAFVGLHNFWIVLTTPGMVRVTLFTLIWAVSNVFFHVLFGLALALALNRPGLKGKMVYRTLMLLPWAIPGYISVLAWNGMLQPDGLVNGILGTNIEFLGGVTSARVAVILVNIWLGVPFMMASFSGALQAIPGDMYEAAELDGVSRWDQLRYLTLPNLKSTAVPVSLLGFIWSFNSFNTIYLLTRGAPFVGFGEPGATDILITYVFNVAFKFGHYGVAAAWSVVIFVMLLAFSWVYVRKTGATEAAA